MAKILITGGNGVLGQAISKLFISNHTDFLIASRSKVLKSYTTTKTPDFDFKWLYMDLSKKETLNKYSEHGINTILHVASLPLQKIRGEYADVVLTRNLLESIQPVNIKHFIYISIVGIDKIPFSYYQGKLECEKLIATSGIPYTILRATQFHDFVDGITRKLLKFPVALVPKLAKVQPIQVEAVALEMDKIIKKTPLNNIENIGGRNIYTMNEIVDSWQKFQQQKRFIFNMPARGKVMKALIEGYNTCDNIALSSNTWEEYLKNKYVTQV